MKIGGKAKAGLVNENLQAYQVKAQQNLEKRNCSEETSKLVTETLSKEVESEGFPEGGKDA